MKKWSPILILLWASIAYSLPASAQTTLHYHLTYSAPGDKSVHVRIDLPSPRPAPLALIMPRNYPGEYGSVPYDKFVEDLRAFSNDGKTLGVKRAPDGPRWSLGAAGDEVTRVEYSVDVVHMENEILDGVDTSKIRPRYVGLLGYSVFAFIDGLEDAQVELQVDAPPDWPVFSTVAPVVPAPLHSASVSSLNYYALADAELLMGPALQLHRFDGTIALFMAVYAEGNEGKEGNEDLALESNLARTALDRVQRYFGDVPFPAYTVQREILKPLPGHEYDFSQEHLNSGTFVSSIDDAVTAKSTPRRQESELINYAHHMAHSWIPKRAYGEGYMPFTWEMPPVIDTIWFNEGFGRYAGIAALADGMPQPEGDKFLHRQIDGLQDIVTNAPAFIRNMSTVVLSREASFLYSEDFRTGMNIYARGALMAAEMDDRIRQRSQGRESLRDALHAIVLFVQTEHRPFKIDELAPVFRHATGVDVTDILQHWLRPN